MKENRTAGWDHRLPLQVTFTDQLKYKDGMNFHWCNKTEPKTPAWYYSGRFVPFKNNQFSSHSLTNIRPVARTGEQHGCDCLPSFNGKSAALPRGRLSICELKIRLCQLMLSIIDSFWWNPSWVRHQRLGIQRLNNRLRTVDFVGNCLLWRRDA